MKATLAALLCVVSAAPALAQQTAFDGAFHLDFRTPLRTDFPYQRPDRIYTAELFLRGDLDRATSVTVTAQRKFFTNQLTQAQVERTLSPGVAVRAGLLRAPFGIYDQQETYRSGLIDYPMPRVDFGDYGVDYGVRGVGGSVVRGRWQAEGALFGGSGVTVWNDAERVSGGAGRVQLFLPPTAMVGLSHWSGSQPRFDGRQKAVTLTGLDLRYGRPYLVVRAEALYGRVAGGRYAGGYADAFYRLPGLPAWTLVGRAEQLRPSSARGTARQVTLGARWTITPEWTVVANWRQNRIAGRYRGTWTPQTPSSGAWIAQVYRTIALR